MQPTAPCSAGDLRLDAAPAPAVAREDDLAFDVDAKLRELLVVFGRAVVHVHEIGGDVAVGGVGVERRQLSGIARVRIVGDDRLLQQRPCTVRLDEFDDALGRVRASALRTVRWWRSVPTT